MCVVDSREVVSGKDPEARATCLLVSDDAHVTKRCVCSVEMPGANWKSVEA